MSFKRIYIHFVFMCTHGRFIRNKYTGSQFFVKCGHCEACLQEKANKRTNRLRNEMALGQIALFVTLTYDRDSCPYIKVSDIENKVHDLNVYRDCVVRSNGRNKGVTKYLSTELLTTVYNPDYYSLLGDLDSKGIDIRRCHLKTLKHRKHNIGVIYYPDVQNFIKRLSINLKRKYKTNVRFKYFSCSEYGESTIRPHHHLLIFIPYTYESTFRAAIVEAWSYGDKNRTRRNIEVARNAASYVSSYVNCGSNFPTFLKDNFSPKHSYSKGLGMGLSVFKLDSILQKIDTGNLYYSQFVYRRDGVVLVNLPIPKYVINYYFPVFKGYSRITDTSLCDLFRVPFKFLRYKEIDYSLDDIHKITTRVLNAYERSFAGHMNFDCYLQLYERAWSCYRSTCYRLFMEDDMTPLLEKYDNIYQAFLSSKDGGVSPSFVVPDGITLNPNDFKSRVIRTNNLEDLYNKKLKTKTVNNIVLSNIYDDF